MTIVPCQTCGRPFPIYPADIRWGHKNYCSADCSGRSKEWKQFIPVLPAGEKRHRRNCQKGACCACDRVRENERRYREGRTKAQARQQTELQRMDQNAVEWLQKFR